MKTLIISDVHLGSRRSESHTLLNYLHKSADEFDRIIINGDFFDSMDFDDLSENHFKVLAAIRTLGHSKQLIWIYGNHDAKIKKLWKHLLGINVVRSYSFIENGVRFYITHGHLLNPFYKVNSKLISFILWTYKHIVQGTWMDPGSAIAKFVDRVLRDPTERYARHFAFMNEYDWIIVGHTHVPKLDKPYLNCGAWVDNLHTYVIVNDDGTVQMNEYLEEVPSSVSIDHSPVPANFDLLDNIFSPYSGQPVTR